MNFDSDYARNMATQLAQYDVQAPLARLDRNDASYRGQLDAVNKLDSALRTFRTAVRDLKGVGASSMLVNKATMSQDGIATAAVSTNAVPGNYQFVVEQLASQHQLALNGMQPIDVRDPATAGDFKIEIGTEQFVINLGSADADGDKQVSPAELSAAINQAADNVGVSATLVRSGEEISLVLTSDESGEANALTLSSTNPGLQTGIDAKMELATALDATVRLGGRNGLVLVSPSNTFDNLIDGVSLTFNRVHGADEAPLSIAVGQDGEATKAKAKTFVDALNTLMSAFDSLTASGGETAKRGPLAGDSSIRSIENMLNRELRNEFGGVRLMDFGISSDRNGLLKLDTAQLEKAVAANPEGFDQLFTGEDNLLATLESNLNLYTNSTNGIMKNRKESLNLMLRRNDDQMAAIEQQYDRSYSRYLTQFTSMMQMMQSMEQTQGMFG
ncbi:flagellar filament capping protein FliD [Pseudomonas profundi]|uniref:flagellar filament capping protein FliD n=1 Tax=Pseudomonas profundi TaxID=1981513 RepID=UPI00123A51E4|nr:flagellar filament capping protein FliD [Pseudomonas profundi]